MSHDECRTWPVAKVVDDGPASYSDLCIAPDGTICCLRGEHLPLHAGRGATGWALRRRLTAEPMPSPYSDLCIAPDGTSTSGALRAE